MATEKELSVIGSNLGVFIAFLFLLFSFASLTTNFSLFNFVYYIIFSYMILGSIFMILMMIFRPVLNNRKLSALDSSIKSSSKLNLNFFLNYGLLSISYFLPFIFDGNVVLKVLSLISFSITIAMLIKMFHLNKKISIENKIKSK